MKLPSKEPLLCSFKQSVISAQSDMHFDSKVLLNVAEDSSGRLVPAVLLSRFSSLTKTVRESQRGED